LLKKSKKFNKKKRILVFLILILMSANSEKVFSQFISYPDKMSSDLSASEFSLSKKRSVLNDPTDHFLFSQYKSSLSDRNESSASTLPIAIGVASFLYLFNPILLLENDKIGGGITKEVSLGFGKFGQHRFSTEYSYIFRQDLSSNLRFAYKYDILLKSGLKPSNFLQGTTVLSIGGGYFTNFTNHGYFPELSYGYSIRNDKLLFFPSLKIRYTYVVNGADIVDFSFGLVIGIANPFIDLNIRANDSK